MKKVFFLVNKLEEYDFEKYLNKHLHERYETVVGESLPINSNEYELVVLWNHHKILKEVIDKKNIIVFHSSDLPEGKGWSPIFYTFLFQKEYFHITGIIASDKVDSGNIISKAKFRMRPNYTAKYLRTWDVEICIMMLRGVLDRMRGEQLNGLTQHGNETFYARRKPDDNLLDIGGSLEGQIPLLKACEEKFPAYFLHNGTKFIVNIEPEVKPVFPEDLEISYFI